MCVNDPSAGSPTETLLRFLLPLIGSLNRGSKLRGYFFWHASPDVSPLSLYFSFGCLGWEGAQGTTQAGAIQSCCLALATVASSIHTLQQRFSLLSQGTCLGAWLVLFLLCTPVCFCVNFLVLLMSGHVDAISSVVAPGDKIDLHIYWLRRALLPIC